MQKFFWPDDTSLSLFGVRESWEGKERVEGDSENLKKAFSETNKLMFFYFGKTKIAKNKADCYAPDDPADCRPQNDNDEYGDDDE